MKILVANKDRTNDLGADIQRAARVRMRGKEREVPARIPPEISALSPAQPKSETEYLDNLIRLIRYRDAVGTIDFDIPRRPGLAGLFMTRLKVLFWKLLRYQHDWIVFRQNLINGLHTHALEYELISRRKAMARLDQRLKRLEARFRLETEKKEPPS